MRTFLTITIILFAVAVQAESLFTKDIFLDFVATNVTEELCTNDLNDCLNQTTKKCKKDIDKYVFKECSDDVPDELNTQLEVEDQARIVSTCVSKMYMSKHQSKLVKNYNTAACQSFLE